MALLLRVPIVSEMAEIKVSKRVVLLQTPCELLVLALDKQSCMKLPGRFFCIPQALAVMLDIWVSALIWDAA